MSLSKLLAGLRDALPSGAIRPATPSGGCVLFLSFSDGLTRAEVIRARAATPEAAWEAGARECLARGRRRGRRPVRWLRVDWVTAVESTTWAALTERLAGTKRNYFRHGLALDPEFRVAFLEQELNANAMLYGGSQVEHAVPNRRNFALYAAKRFGKGCRPDLSPQAPVQVFATEGLFLAADPRVAALPGGAGPLRLIGPGAPGTPWNAPAALNAGRRGHGDLTPADVRALIDSGAGFLARQVGADGRFTYGHFPCFGRTIPAYNALRHASSAYAMLEAWEITRSDGLMAAIRRALSYLAQTLVQHAGLPGGGRAAFVVDAGGEIKLGANAVAILALVKHAELTGEDAHPGLAGALAAGIAHMQDARTGGFVHVLDAADLSVKDAFRIIYYDGEAVFALLRLYGLTREARWLDTAARAFDHFIAAGHWKAHDHWLSYAANEITRHRPEDRYFRFGVQNVAGYLDFMEARETTYPTLLELCMAFRQMLDRIARTPGAERVLEGFDTGRFMRVLHHRAHYGLNGFFWPELAMYFDKPATIAGSFFIRHHAFRVRIDDVEHYLSGYVAYLKMLEGGGPGGGGLQAETETAAAPAGEAAPQAPSAAPGAAATGGGPVVAWGGDVNLGRRQHYRTAELGAANVLRIPALAGADLSIVNLECVVATGGEQGVPKGEGGPYYYRARPAMLGVLAAAGVDAVATANNHAGDYGPGALMEQAGWLDRAGIGHAGSGADAEAAFAPLMLRAGPYRVALFSVDATQPRFAAGPHSPGTAWLPPGEPARWRAGMAPRIARARAEAGADHVLVAVHWGPNGAAAPDADEIAAGHALIDAGADAVLGASAHVLQGVEVHRGRPILHDAGDLLFDAVRRRPAAGGVFRLTLGPAGVRGVEFVPVAVGFGESEQLSGPRAVRAARAFAAKCAALGCGMEVTPDGRGRIALAPEPRAAPPPAAFDAADARWRADAVPDAARIAPVALGPLRLLGLRAAPERLDSRRMLWVESFWTADAPVAEDLRLDIRAVAEPAGAMPDWGEGMDHDPCDWMLPTSRWQPGAIYRDYIGLRPPPPARLRSATLRIEAGLTGGAAGPEPRVATGQRVRVEIAAKPAAPPAYRTDFPPLIRDCPPGATWTAAQLAAVTCGRWLTPPPEGWAVRSVVSGAKHIGMLPGPALFVAHDSEDRARHEQSTAPVQGNDRHRLLPGLHPRLAGAIVARPVAGLPPGFPLLQVEDPIRAIIELGLAARQRFAGEVVALTGTAGKSTTAAMLCAALGGPGRVLASIDNYNSRVGAPSLLASLAPDHAAAVVEVAQSALWMRRGPVTRLIRPTVALITEIGLSQTDRRVKSVADTARWKSRVFDGLTGAAVAVAGDHLDCLDTVLAKARRHARRIVRFGTGAGADIRILGVEADGHGSRVALDTPQGRIALHLPVPGAGMVRNAAGALAVCWATGRDLRDAAAALAGFVPEEGRLQRARIAAPGGSADLIDDSWNATVTSMLNAFSVLAATPARPGGRRIAVLGRIVHLGDLARPLHESLAGPLLETGVDLVLTHGPEMEHLRARLPAGLLGPHFLAAEPLAEHLRAELRAGDLILVKGSRRDSDFGRVCTLLRTGPEADAARLRPTG